MNLQELLDQLTYPPTHTYLLPVTSDGPTATGVLKERVAAMHAAAPEFFRPGNRMFLDVGCNKGFFSLLGKQLFSQVVGIDPISAYADLCRAIVPAGIFHHCGFRDFVPAHRFDRVLIANGPHHLYAEASHTWDWVMKLGVIVAPGGLVLTEGIPNESDPDGDEFPGLSQADFERAMHRWFTLEAQVPSPSYTPGRTIMLWRRRDLEYWEPIETIAIGPILRAGDVSTGGTVAPRWHKCHVAELRDQPRAIIKWYNPLPPTPLWPRIALAAALPGASPVSLWVIKNGHEVGWIEPAAEMLDQDNTPVEIRLAAWKLLIDGAITMARVGYAETDFSLINVGWCHGSLVHVDKNGVFPVADLQPGHYDYVGGSLATSLRSFGVPEFAIMNLCNVYAQKDPFEIERVLKDVYARSAA